VLRTENSVVIAAPSALVFQLAAHVDAWPEILEHYRYVRILEQLRPFARRVKMAASRDGIPVSWTAIQEMDSERNEIRYHHVAGVTRGMDVLWRIADEPGGCRVTIDHELDTSRWWLRNRFANFIVAEVFVKTIADRTLRGVKMRAEAIAAGATAR
jgi:aromatase